MDGATDLATMLATLHVVREPGVVTVATIPEGTTPPAETHAWICEREGITVVLDRDVAIAHGFPHEFEAAWLTLTVHSSLEAVGLTAAVSERLAQVGIPANVLAGHYHDHILVPVGRADEAIDALHDLRTPPNAVS